MFDREFFDAFLPAGELLEKKVRHCLVECFKVELPCPDTDLNWLLTKLGEFSEDEYSRWFRREASWQDSRNPDFEYDGQHWQLFARGVDYKPSHNYLTNDGWPLGTKCWFVTIEYGWRERATAETPLLAVQRAIIILCACVRTSKTRPSQRKEVMETVKDIMQEE